MPLSGAKWVAEFPTSSSIDDLVEPFRTNVDSFLSALDDAGAKVAIADTLRPPKRVYLMHWSFVAANGSANQGRVPLHDGVVLQWVNADQKDNTDPTATKAAAADMVRAYGV